MDDSLMENEELSTLGSAPWIYVGVHLICKSVEKFLAIGMH